MVNSQNIGKILYCLGDGHDGIWNLFAQIARLESRQEILDWYHLKENLYKIQASKKFLVDIESELWYGQVEQAITKLNKSKCVGVTQFTNYLRKHRHRLVNYMYFQAEQLSSIGSGAVESAVKQIDKRLQIVGAQWKYDSIPYISNSHFEKNNRKFCYLNRELMFKHHFLADNYHPTLEIDRF